MQWNIYKLAALLNLEPSENLFFEAFPINRLTCVIRFANRVTDVMVYLKLERFEMVQGGIIMWHGLLAAIPPDYTLCDGTNGTPDLREKFVLGTANGIDPGGVGGSINHAHDFTGDGHTHTRRQPGDLAESTPANNMELDHTFVTGTTDPGGSLPPFYEIAYIMKL
ncbi:hypothetical protein ES703_30966 [subsurface metagenome]